MKNDKIKTFPISIRLFHSPISAASEMTNIDKYSGNGVRRNTTRIRNEISKFGLSISFRKTEYRYLLYEYFRNISYLNNAGGSTTVDIIILKNIEKEIILFLTDKR